MSGRGMRSRGMSRPRYQGHFAGRRQGGMGQVNFGEGARPLFRGGFIPRASKHPLTLRGRFAGPMTATQNRFSGQMSAIQIHNRFPRPLMNSPRVTFPDAHSMDTEHAKSFEKEAAKYMVQRPNFSIPSLLGKRVSSDPLVRRYEKLLCKRCNRKFDTKQALIEHARVVHDSLPFICRTCKRGFTDDARVRRHIKHEHTGPKNIICQEAGCDFRTNDPKVLIHHDKLHKKIERYKREGRPISERWGGSGVPKPSADGVASTSTGKGPTCGIAKGSNAGIAAERIGAWQASYNLPNPIQSTQPAPSLKTEDHCKPCELWFATKDHFLEHARQSHDCEPLFCSICDGGLLDTRHLLEHMWMAHGTKMMQCGVCSFKTNSTQVLDKHMRLHREEGMQMFNA